MPKGIRQLGARAGREWVASIFAAVVSQFKGGNPTGDLAVGTRVDATRGNPEICGLCDL